MSKKINRQMILLSLLGILLVSVSLTIVFYRLHISRVKEDIRKDAQLLEQSGVFDDPKASAGPEIALSDVRITWVDADGKVLYDSDSDASSMENHADRPEILQAVSEGESSIIRRSDTMAKSTFYYARCLPNGTILRVAETTQNLSAILRTAIPITALICILIIILSVFLARVLTKHLVRPIDRMAEQLGSGEPESAYPELIPFANRLREQHEDILRNAQMRRDFTANVSHELKTPLTAISGYAELIENEMIPPGGVRKAAGEIRLNSERLLTLINDIIRLSQLDSLEENAASETFDLNEEAERVVRELQVHAAKNRVRLAYHGEKAILRGSREMICELVMNLADNAIRYNYPNGFVKVAVGCKENRPFLKVEDNGIGIPKEQQERVFERFYRVDKSRSRQTGGTGLGLAIVKHIVMLHGAELELDSSPGIGTTITVEF